MCQAALLRLGASRDSRLAELFPSSTDKIEKERAGQGVRISQVSSGCSFFSAGECVRMGTGANWALAWLRLARFRGLPLDRQLEAAGVGEAFARLR